MKKKIIIGTIIIMCFLLVGCGKSNDDIEETIDNNQTNNVNTSGESNAKSEDIKLYSDNTKYVFEMGNVKHVFYYSGEEITAYHAYLDYGDANTAQLSYNLLKAEDLDDVDKYYVNGKYLVFEYNKSQYEDMKASDLKTAYSYMKEITK